MKNKTFVSIVVILVVVLGFLFVTKIGSDVIPSSAPGVYNDSQYPLSFSYQIGRNGYVFFADELFEKAKQSDPNLVRILVLIEERENQALLRDIENGVAREGPPQITIFVINNKEKLTLENWLKQSPISNFKQIIGEAKDTTLGDKNALSYESDGLYRNETVVSASDDYIYVFNVTFNSREDKIYKDFLELLTTVQL